MPNQKDTSHDSIGRSERIVSAVGQISHDLRDGVRQSGTAECFNRASVDITEILVFRAVPVRLSWIATQLSTSLPSLNDSVSALASKSLIEKSKAFDNGRTVAVHLTKLTVNQRTLAATQNLLRASLKRTGLVA